MILFVPHRCMAGGRSIADPAIGAATILGAWLSASPVAAGKGFGYSQGTE